MLIIPPQANFQKIIFALIVIVLANNELSCIKITL